MTRLVLLFLFFTGGQEKADVGWDIRAVL